jgi:predicted naringenin-chalcone synthase
MASTGRIPLWLIGTVGGIAALTVVRAFLGSMIDNKYLLQEQIHIVS